MPEVPSNNDSKVNDRDDILNSFADDDKPIKDEKQVKEAKESKEDKSLKDDRQSDEEDGKDESDDETGVDDEVELKEDEKIEEEKLDLKDEIKDEISVPPKKKMVEEAYPGFFKKFPFFEKMMFRDRQYTEMFGSFDDAKEVNNRAQILNSFEQDLLKGDVSEVLKQTKENAPESFKKLVDNYLPQLANVDREAYFHIIENVSKSIVREMLKDKNDDVKSAAKVLGKFILPNYDSNDDRNNDLEPKKLSIEKPKDEETDKERREFYQEKYEDARVTVQTKVDNVLRSTIDSYIDPRNQMSAYTKKNAIKDALAAVHESIGKDADFKNNLDRLWKRAFNEKFSSSSTDSIRQSYLGKAKGLLNQIIRNTRNEALKDITPQREEIDEKEMDDEKEDRPKKRIAQSGNPRQQDGKSKDKNARRPGESLHEFFARD